MKANLTKYLSDVFRNEVQDKAVLKSQQHESTHTHLNDPKVKQFLVDRKYALRLDEII